MSAIALAKARATDMALEQIWLPILKCRKRREKQEINDIYNFKTAKDSLLDIVDLSKKLVKKRC